MLIRTFCSLSIIAAVSIVVFGQSSPSNIRGYKVYNARIVVSTNANDGPLKADAIVKIDTPALESVGLGGIVLTVGGEITPAKQSGKVDLLAFRDFRINGVAVEIDEYQHSFVLKELRTFRFDAPVRVRVSKKGIAVAASNELAGSRKKWAVSGTVLVFGKFRRYGFDFKRVIPVHIDIEIDNPIKSFTDLYK
jgi:hypothetical protein